MSGQIGERGIDTKLCVHFKTAEAWMEKPRAGKRCSKTVIGAGEGGLEVSACSLPVELKHQR